MSTYMDDLYNGKLYPAEQICPHTKEYLTVLHNLSDLHGSFEKMLTPSLKNAFEAFLDEQHHRISMEIHMINNYIGRTLKKIRELKGLTQKELGGTCNLPQSRMAQYETGNRIPKESQLQLLAQVLGVNIQAFRDIDINIDDKESVKQLIFQLEEKNCLISVNLM